MIYYFISFLIVAFGQNAWVPNLGILASSCGLAIFWVAISKISSLKKRFLHSFLWFFFVQLVQLSWLASVDYMGLLIYVVYAMMAAFLGLQFGFLGLFVEKSDFGIKKCFFLAGSWALLEWSRLFICSGFTWNPIGLSLADSNYAIQFSSLFGVYGLSFWVILVNAFALTAFLKMTKKAVFVWSCLALFPYCYGFFQEKWVLHSVPVEKTISVALVQTGILPEQKDFFYNKKEAFISPIKQWERIFSALDPHQSCDLIVLPEAVVTLGARRAGFSLEEVKNSWETFFKEASLKSFPPLRAPFAKPDAKTGSYKVTNAFIAQALANHFQAEVMAGFDDEEAHKKYNAVFHFEKDNGRIERYEKRVLVPIGEYMPLSSIGWLSKWIAKEFGIGDSFHAGKRALLFQGTMPTGVSVCVEETYSHLIRDLRLLGARLLVNVTNDVWFPRSRLPVQHFQHARIRSAENGVYSLRSCNSGVTGVVDCFGKMVQTLEVSEDNVKVLYCQIPLRSFSTIYTWFGDGAILFLSLFIVMLYYKERLQF